jgi:serine/threonine protein kinase
MFDARSLHLPPYRGLIAAAYEHPETIAALGDLPGLLRSPSSEILQSGRNKIVAVRLPGSAIDPVEAVVKIFGARGFHKLKTLLLPSKGVRAWHGAVALRGDGFETPGPIAVFERRRFGVAVESVFVAERVRGGREIRDLFRETPESDLRGLLEAFAPVLAGLHAAGLVHRDLSDGNVLVFSDDNPSNFPSSGGDGPGEASSAVPSLSSALPKIASDLGIGAKTASPSPFSSSGPRFCFLDTIRVRRRRNLSPFGRARNLVRLGVSPSLRPFFLDRYVRAAGASFSRSRFEFYYRTAKRSFESWLAFKKKLRLRTIAKKLRLQ